MDCLAEASRLIEQARRELAGKNASQVAQLQLKVAQLESENKALRQTVQILQTKRRQDRDRVRQWETAFTQNSLETLTQLGSDTVAIHRSQPGPELPPSSQPIISASLPLDEPSSDLGELPPPEGHLPDENLEQNPDENSDEKADEKAEETADEKPEKADLPRLLDREWHPSDFIVNPNYGKAHTEVVRGHKRRCLHGNDCDDCAKFYALLGERGAAAMQKSSRHREEWHRQATPPGFWRSDFVDTQQHACEKGDLAASRAAEAGARLDEALANGRYLFRDRALRELVNRMHK